MFIFWRKYHLLNVSVLIIFLALFFLNSPVAAQETASFLPGTLLRCSGDAAVYYVGQNNRFHPFPDEATYHSWYRNFSGVKNVPASACDSLSRGQAVTIRPGTFLVQRPDSPTIYAVAAPNTLRHVTSEAVAEVLYGQSWGVSYPAGPLYTLSENVSALYQIGAPIVQISDYVRDVERAACPTINTCLSEITSGTPFPSRSLASIINRSLPVISRIQESIPPAVQKPIPTIPLRIPRPNYIAPFSVEFPSLFPLPILVPEAVLPAPLATATTTGATTTPVVSPMTTSTTTTVPLPPVAPETPIVQVSGSEFTAAISSNTFQILPQSRYDTLDANGTMPGHLTIIPSALPVNGWQGDKQGISLFRTFTGNFVIEIDVNATRRGDTEASYHPGLAPRGKNNTAGVLIRDPASISPGRQRWLSYGLGFGYTSLSREIKGTWNNPAGVSFTDMFLNAISPTGIHTGKLRVCRVADTFYFYHKHPQEHAWVEETYAPSTQLFGKFLFATGKIPNTLFSTPLRMVRSDLPPTLQIGLFAGNMNLPFDLRAEFDYIRIGTPETVAGCVMNLPSVDPVPTNILPTISLTAPTNGSLFPSNSNVSLSVAVDDRDGYVSAVEFYHGTTKIGEDGESPFSITWANVPTGVYTLTAKAFDNRGGAVTSLPVDISVSVPETSSGGGGGAGEDVDDLTAFGDEFSDNTSLADWTVQFTQSFTSIDINISNAGQLTVIPGNLSQVPVSQRYWYANGFAPFIYKNITGNFVVETSVNAHRTGDQAQAPNGNFASGGLLIRDANSPSPTTTINSQNWFMYNVGTQGFSPNNIIGTERKSTVNSVSTLSTKPASHTARLRICRIGGDIYSYRMLSGESTWTLEPVAALSNPLVRSDFSAELQVGLTAGVYNGASDMTVEFDYVRFAVPTSEADCTATIAPAS